MRQIITCFLLFFVLFTHSAIAMDVCISGSSDDHPAQVADSGHNNSSLEFNPDPCGDLGGHCSHSSAHTAGLASSVNLLPFLDLQPVSYSSLNPFLLLPKQTPPLRPPKNII